MESIFVYFARGEVEAQGVGDWVVKDRTRSIARFWGVMG